MLPKLVYVFALHLLFCEFGIHTNCEPLRFKSYIGTNDNWSEKWNYVTVRPDAHMFWWTYYSSENSTPRPLILWLQGGPGGSSTGFGNFEEIGPLDDRLQSRNTTWLSLANLLFIDNPVGTGYSYVTNDTAYATNEQMIADDLVTALKDVMSAVPQFQAAPFYIFSESYGGKMAAAFSRALLQAIRKGKLNCNFKGTALGDSWISPIDSVMTWGPYLYATSLVDEVGLKTINDSAVKAKQLVDSGQWSEATNQWAVTENVVSSVTNGVNFYNILQWGGSASKQPEMWKNNYIQKLYNRHVKVMENDILDTLMNGPIKKKLGIIPDSVKWGGQSSAVFIALVDDFMRPVVDIVDDLLLQNVTVIIYSGQLDLIVDTLGTEQWVQRLKWSELDNFNRAQRQAASDTLTGNTLYFSKSYKNLAFYWILKAGHMVPSDAGQAALTMVQSVFNL